MKTELKDISPTQKELHIQVDAEAVKSAYGKISQRYAKGANVPGFRKGFAPLDVVRVRYKEEIKQEVLQLLLPEKVSEAIREHGLQPLTEPQLHLEDAENIKVNGSAPLSLHVHVEVMPEIPDPNYKGIELVRRVKPVEESEIEELIETRLTREAALIPVEDRASEMGDTVIADLVGRFEDEPDGDPITADDLEIKLGDDVIERSFTENLVGVKADDEKEFTVTYPEEFSSAALAGKTVHYKAKIKSVGKTETPEANDEWAQSLDEGYESMADLRSKLRADLETYSASDADARLRNVAIGKVIDDNAFEVPSVLIENQARNLLNNFARDLQQRGVDLNAVGSDFVQTAFEQMRSQAERDVRGAMLLDKIAAAEKIDVSQEEIDEEITKMAEYYQVTPDVVKESLKKQGGSDSIANNLRTRKSIEAIVSHAKVSEGEWVDGPDGEAVDEPAEKTKKAAKPKAKAADGDDNKETKSGAKKAAKK